MITSLGHEINEVKLGESAANVAELLKRNPDARTVPQVFLGDTLIGGYTDLLEMKNNGKLEKLLETAI